MPGNSPQPEGSTTLRMPSLTMTGAIHSCTFDVQLSNAFQLYPLKDPFAVTKYYIKRGARRHMPQ